MIAIYELKNWPTSDAKKSIMHVIMIAIDELKKTKNTDLFLMPRKV